MGNVRLKNQTSRDAILDAGDRCGPARKLSDLYKRHAQELRAYILKKFGNVDGDEIIQTVFFNLARNGGLPDVRHPRGYLYRAVDNAVTDESRRDAVRRHYHEDGTHELANPLYEELTPERIVSAKMELVLVIGALKLLPEKQQRLLMMYRVGNLTYQRISEIMNMPVPTVHRHIVSATKELNEIVHSMRGRTDDDR